MKTLLIVLAFTFILFSNEINAQWQKTFGPFGWTVSHFTEGNGFIYSSGGKVFRSSDNGMTWKEKSEGIWQWDVSAFFFSNNRVFAAMDGGNGVGYLYVSDDNGESWLQHNNTGNSKNITSFTKLGNDIYFSTYQGGIFKSTNNGDTWVQTIASWDPKPAIFSLVTLGNTLYFGEYTGLYKSTDGGFTWSHCPNPDNGCEVFSIAVKGNTLYMVYGSCWGYTSSVYKSNDLGSSFQLIAPLISNAMKVYSDGTYIYLSTSDGVLRSADDGTTWTKIAMAGETVQTAMRTSNNNIVIGTRDHGIFTSTNNGVTWINTGVSNFMSTKALLTINNSIIAGNDAQNGVMISRDVGNTFTEFNFLNYSMVNCLLQRGNDIFAGTSPYYSQKGGVHKSTDYGATWDFIGLPNIGIYCLTYTENYLFAGSLNDGVFRSSNDGIMWAQVSNGLPITWVRALKYFNNKLFAGTHIGLYSSTNNGINWQLDGFQNIPITSLEIVNNKLFAGTETGVYKLNESNNWVQTSLSVYIACLKSFQSKLIAGGYDLLSISSDDGNTWTSIKNDNPSQLIYDISFNDEYIFTGNYADGIWKGLINEIITNVEYESENLPNNFILYQNYPNPFNPSTIIKYQVPISGYINLKIYDILGNEIATLVDEYKSPGQYEIKWDASDKTSGVYFCKLQADAFILTRKILLMK